MKRNVADRLYSIIVKRFSKEQPERKLSNRELDCIWFDLYGRLCHGESEQELETYCSTVELRKIEIKNTTRGDV